MQAIWKRSLMCVCVLFVVLGGMTVVNVNKVEAAGTAQDLIDFASQYEGYKYQDMVNTGGTFIFGAWCGNFVNFCANNTNNADIIPNTQLCLEGKKNFINHPTSIWLTRNATPQPGDLFYFNTGDLECYHKSTVKTTRK